MSQSDAIERVKFDLYSEIDIDNSNNEETDWEDTEDIDLIRKGNAHPMFK